MSKLLAASLALVAARTAFANDDPYMYTLTGACDAQSSLDGMTFTWAGNTKSGAPYYKATNAEKYIFYDPDCMGSGDGTPRWLIDENAPDVSASHDLDGDGLCNYIARINSEDTSHPPTTAEWTMNCAGTYQKQYLILLEVTTTKLFTSTTLAGGAGQVTTTTAKPTMVKLSGACESRSGMEGLVFEKLGKTHIGAPYYKAQGVDLYFYYDTDCDGAAGSISGARWILDDNEPSLTTDSDLDGDGACDYHARLLSNDTTALPSHETWTMYCGSEDGWVDVDLDLENYVDEATTTQAHTGTVISGVDRTTTTAFFGSLVALFAAFIAV